MPKFTEAPRPKERRVKWSEWAHPKNQGKYVTRGELISALDIALNNYRKRHTLRGQLSTFFAADWARTKREFSQIAELLKLKAKATDGGA
jgi:hypothetical protein